MKKLFLICALIMSCAMNAQKVFDLTKTEWIDSEHMKVWAGAQSLVLNHVTSDSVAAKPQDYFLAVYKGEDAEGVTVVKKSRVLFVVAEVTKIESTADGRWTVTLDRGRMKTYTSSDPEWGTVLVGQRVSYFKIEGETKRFTGIPYTVDENTPLTTEISVSPAPTSPIIPLDNKNRIIVN